MYVCVCVCVCVCAHARVFVRVHVCCVCTFVFSSAYLIKIFMSKHIVFSVVVVSG